MCSMSLRLPLEVAVAVTLSRRRAWSSVIPAGRPAPARAPAAAPMAAAAPPTMNARLLVLFLPGAGFPCSLNVTLRCDAATIT
jgi:hypothetical protein